MFIEKDRRYFRRFTVSLKPRTKFAAALPLVGPEKDWNALDAMRRAVRNRKAAAPQSNGDTIELIRVEHLEKEKLLVLLFHRASPNAADPAYRKRSKNKLTLRQTAKEVDEEQAVSCHVVISTKADGGLYKVALEEIPGLSASGIFSIIARILLDYNYPYVKGGKSLETNTIFKIAGVKSETLENALKKKGALNYLTLTKTLPPDVPDAAGIAEPQTERVKYKVVGNPASATWRKKFQQFIEGTKGTWDQVSVDITLDDERHKTVRVDTEQEASEILFVRSELVLIPGDLNPCSMAVVPSVVKAANGLLKRKA